MALEQADFNAKLRVPTVFHLLNPPAGNTLRCEGVDFVRVDSSEGPVDKQILSLRRLLDRTQPGGATPLVKRLKDIFKGQGQGGPGPVLEGVYRY